MEREELSEFIDNEIGYIVLVTGQNDTGQDCWFYASIAPSKYEDFKRAEKNGAYDLADYGEVLRSGPGRYPPQDITREMEAMYSLSDDFEKDYKKMVKKLSAMKL